MLQTPAPSSAVDATNIADRIALPFLVFTGSLFGMLMFSWLFFLPQFASVNVSGVSLAPQEVQAYQQKMTADLRAMEQKRDHLVLPVQNATYTALKHQRAAQPSVFAIRAMLLDAAMRVGRSADAITFSDITFDALSRTVVVSGDVAHVGTRSMTILASYVDAVASLPFVGHLDRPAFTRVDDGHGNMHSPFTMTMTIKTTP